MNLKYELTDETLVVGVHLLHRIRAVRDFGDVKAGDLGGWIEDGRNLSHNDNCWVYGEAKVFEGGLVYGEAKVFVNAKIYGSARVYGKAKVYDNTMVFDSARVYGNAEVYGAAKVHGQAKVYGHAEIFAGAEIYGFAKVYGTARIFGHTKIHGHSEVYHNSKVYGTVDIKNMEICGGADVCDIGKPYGCDGKPSETTNTPELELPNTPEHVTREAILEAARKCVCGHRVTDYGKPEDNFGSIANLWTDYLKASFEVAPNLTAEDVTMMMALLKIARIASGTGSADSFVDLAGYAACGGEIFGRKKHEEQGVEA